jgi:hypothetical protein
MQLSWQFKQEDLVCPRPQQQSGARLSNLPTQGCRASLPLSSIVHQKVNTHLKPSFGLALSVTDRESVFAARIHPTFLVQNTDNPENTRWACVSRLPNHF